MFSPLGDDLDNIEEESWGSPESFDNNSQDVDSDNQEWILPDSQSEAKQTSGNSWKDADSNSAWGSSDWGIPQTTQQDSLDNQSLQQQDSFYGQSSVQQDTTQQQPQLPKKPFNFGFKGIGLILSGLFIVIALLLLMLDSVKVTPKQQTQPKTSTQQTQQAQQPSQSQSVSGNVSMIEIPDSTSLDYSGGMLEATGTVVGKSKYLEGHQVVYCIVIRIAAGSATEDIKHYCNYDSYSAVEIGDLIQLTYQQVQTGYISLNKVIKN